MENTIQYICGGCDKKSTERKYNDKRLKRYAPFRNTFETVAVPSNEEGYIEWKIKCTDCGYIN